MVDTDKLYYVTDETPFDAPLLGTLPAFFGNGTNTTYGASWTVLSGYSSGTHIPSAGGPYGTMIYGSGGHSFLGTELLSVDLNADVPVFDWWQLAAYKTSDTGGADMYYDPTAAAALIAGPRGTASRIRATDETADAAAWDRVFPVSFDGWIFPRKLTTAQLGDGVPNGYRYALAGYIPASVTGADPIFFVPMGQQGPFSQGSIPAGVSNSDWFEAAALDGGERKAAYYFQNCTTKVWNEYKWLPAGFGTGSFGGQRTGVFTDNKRVYVCCYISSSPSVFYIDFTAGIAGHTISTPVTGLLEFHKYSGGAFSDGDSAGRHFCVAPKRSVGTTSSIVVYNFDTTPITSFEVDLSAFGFSMVDENEWVGASYDSVNQRVLIVFRDPTTRLVEYWSIVPPATLTDAGSWTASKRTLWASDAAMVSSIYTTAVEGDGLSNFYGKVRFLPSLGVVLIASNTQRMLAFRPSA